MRKRIGYYPINSAILASTSEIGVSGEKRAATRPILLMTNLVKSSVTSPSVIDARCT